MGNDKFSTLWFSGMLLGVSLLMIFKGGKIALRRELENPLFPLQGGRAVALGGVMVAAGLLGVVLAAFEGMKLR